MFYGICPNCGVRTEFWEELTSSACACSSCFQEVLRAEVEVIDDYESQILEYESYDLSTQDFNDQFDFKFCLCDYKEVSDTYYSDNCRYCTGGCHEN